MALTAGTALCNSLLDHENGEKRIKFVGYPNREARSLRVLATQ